MSFAVSPRPLPRRVARGLLAAGRFPPAVFLEALAGVFFAEAFVVLAFVVLALAAVFFFLDLVARFFDTEAARIFRLAAFAMGHLVSFWVKSKEHMNRLLLEAIALPFRGRKPGWVNAPAWARAPDGGGAATFCQDRSGLFLRHEHVDADDH